ncbi:ATP-binding protein [Chitinophagaceae bacterium LWZ2-11]
MIACGSLARSKNNTAVINNIIGHADSLISIGKPNQSLSFLDSSYNKLTGLSKKDLYRRYEFIKNYYLYTDNNRNLALNYADSLLVLCEDEPTTDGITKKDCAEALFSKGEILLGLNRYAEAYQFFFKGKLWLDKGEDSCTVNDYHARFNTQLGNVSYKQKKYRDAIGFYKSALKDLLSCSINPLPGKLYGIQDNIGLSYGKLNIPDSAVHYYDLALHSIDLQEKIDTSITGFHANENARGVVLGNRADIYLIKKDTAKAEELLQESIAINNRPGYSLVDAHLNMLKLGRLYLLQKKYNEVKNKLSETGTFLDTVNNDEVKIPWLLLQSDYSDKENALPRSHFYLKQYQELKDKIDNYEKKLDDTPANVTYENIERQYELEFFRKQNQQQNIYLIAVFIFLMMAIAIIILVLQNDKRSKKNMKQLRELNDQTSKQNMVLQTTLRALEQSQDDNSRMMKVVAHDLRSPIAAMLSISHMLLNERNALAPEMQRLLEMLNTSGENSLQLIQDMLQSKQINMPMHSVDMEALLQDCIGLLRIRADDKKQTIYLETTPVTILANRGSIWRLMTNLINNAIKFSPKYGSITVKMSHDEKRVLLTIEDEGIGIPESLKANIFDAFTNAKRPGTSGEESYGLGLSIAKQIVLAHKGKICLDSMPGKGTVFYIELPV